MATRNCFGHSDAGFDGSFPWLAGAMLAYESCEVIRIRLTMFATGDDDAGHEAHLMVAEKIEVLGMEMKVPSSVTISVRNRPISRTVPVTSATLIFS